LPADILQSKVGPPLQVRSLETDCTQTWVYPDGGAAAGLFALHDDLLAQRRPCLPALLPCPATARDPFIARRLAGASLSFEQPVDGQLPAFALFEQRAEGSRYAAASTRPGEGHASVLMEGPLAFLDAVVYVEGQGIEVETWWQVAAGPIDRAFSIMGHGLDGTGKTVALSDGLGVSPLALQTGDVIVQRHRFPDAGGIDQFRTGAYWFDTLERWPLAEDPATDTLTFSLDQLVQTDGQKR
jgi:hypothetical protein